MAWVEFDEKGGELRSLHHSWRTGLHRNWTISGLLGEAMLLKMLPSQDWIAVLEIAFQAKAVLPYQAKPCIAAMLFNRSRIERTC